MYITQFSLKKYEEFVLPYWISYEEVGEYKNGKSHGRIIFHDVNGEVEERIYENGERVDQNDE